MAATHAHRTHSHNPADEEAAATERDAGSRGLVFSAQSRELDCPCVKRLFERLLLKCTSRVAMDFDSELTDYLVNGPI